ncbi:MAG: response regulator [Granulosicoccaceae bacterium]
MKKILVVEDDRKIAKALSVRLRSLGYDVGFAYDAAMALTHARDTRPDMVIIDINLPAGNGFQVAERLQEAPETAGTPFMFITASRKAGLRGQAMKVGAKSYLEKPFLASDLVNSIENVLGAA